MCYADDDVPLICFYAIEYHLPDRVARQFGLRQEWPVPPFSTSIELHKIDRRRQKKMTDFETLHHAYIDEWDLFDENINENEEPHTNSNFRRYLAWYLGATRTKLKGQWTQTDYGDIESSDDEDTSYDLATRAGTVVEVAPILDRVGNALKQSVMDIERFPRIGVDESALSNFLGRLARRLRRAAARCGCRTMPAVDMRGPSPRRSDTIAGVGTSTPGPAGLGGQSSSTQPTFEDSGGDDAEERGPSELQDAPLTQQSQPPLRRLRRPREPYTPGTDALGAKGKGKARKE